MDDPDLMPGLVTIGVAIAVALALHLVVFRALFRFGWRTETARRLQYRARWPARTTVALLAAAVAVPAARLPATYAGPLAHGLLLALITSAAWLVLRVAYVFEETALHGLDLGARDNLLARRKQTQVVVLRRVVVVAIVVLAGAGMLLTFDQARTLGASLLASAGVAGLIAGIAARSTLGNMVAGVQIAFSEPIRLDDVVVVEGEWGRVEEITLTYVVVRVWDDRRLVLPTTYFVEEPFQNWTRQAAQVLGTVVLHVDHRTPVPALRHELGRIVESTDLWDGRVALLQVVDTTEHTMVVRALVSAEDASLAWDLRCEVRERLIAFLVEHHPASLPTLRVLGADREV